MKKYQVKNYESAWLQTGYSFMDQPVEKTTFGKEYLQWQIGKLKENMFTGGYGLDSKRAKVGGKDGFSTEEFHRFGVLWDETGNTFYINGVEDGKITQYLTTRQEIRYNHTAAAGRSSKEVSLWAIVDKNIYSGFLNSFIEFILSGKFDFTHCLFKLGCK